MSPSHLPSSTDYRPPRTWRQLALYLIDAVLVVAGVVLVALLAASVAL